MTLGRALFFPLAMAACTPAPAPPPVAKATPPAAKPPPSPCDRAAALRAEVPALDAKGRIARIIRIAAEADALCPELTGPIAAAISRARFELSAGGDVGDLLDQGGDARASGDLAGARRAFDHAIALAGGARLRDGAPLDGVDAFDWEHAGDDAIARAGRVVRTLSARSGAVGMLGDHAIDWERGATDFDDAGELVENADSLVFVAYGTRRAVQLDVAHPMDARFVPRHGNLVVASSGSSTILWDLGSKHTFAGVAGPGAFAVSPDGNVVAVRKPRGSFPFGVDLVDTTTFAPRGTPLMHTRCDDSATLAWSPDGKRLAVGSTSSFVCIWDLTAAAPRLLHEFDLPVVRPPQGPAPPARWLFFTPDGAGLLGGAAVADPALAQVDLYRVADAARLSSLGIRRHPVALPDGAVLLTSQDAPPVIVSSDLRVATLPLREGDGPVSPDGRAILGTRDGVVRVLDVRQGAVVATLDQATKVDLVAWSPSGRFVSGFVAGRLRVWDASTGAFRANGTDTKSCALEGGDWVAPAYVCDDD